MTPEAPSPVDLPELRRISSSDGRILLVSGVTVASRMLARLAQLAFLIVAARLLSVEEFAGYSYLLVLAVTFSMLADTGVALAASREVSAQRRTPSEAFWSSFPAIACGAALGCALVLGLGLADSAPGSSGAALLLIGLFVPVNTVFNFAATTLRGVGRSVFEALLQGFNALLFVGGAGTVVALGGSLATVLLVLVLKEAICVAVALGGLRHYIGRPRRWTPGLSGQLLRIGIQLGLASTALALTTRIPTVVLANAGSTSDLAWFSSAFRLADTVLLLALTSGYALLPSLTYLFGSQRDRARRLLGLVLAGVAVTGGVVGALVVLFAAEVISFVYGPDFAPATASARALMACAPVYAVVGICWYALVALGLERRLLAIAGATAVLSACLSLALVPGNGDIGASVAYSGALAVMAAAMLFVLARIRTIETAPRLAGDIP